MYGGDAHADYSFLKSCSLGQPVTFLIRLSGWFGLRGGAEWAGQVGFSTPTADRSLILG